MNNLFKKLRRRQNDRNLNRKGATTVEMAICLPVLFLLLFGSYELARANMLLHAAESAAYEGARTGIIPGATQAKIEDSANFVMRSVGASNFTINVTPQVITNDTERVRVEIEVPLRSNTIISGFILGSPTFRGEIEMKRETL